MNDNEILKALTYCRLRRCGDCPRYNCDPHTEDECRIKLMSDVFTLVALYKTDQEKLIAEREQARRDCAAAESRQLIINADAINISEDMFEALKSSKVLLIPSAESSVEIIPTINDFKTALLKKIFPYDTVDKKQYSINAYAVEKAIEEVAEQMAGGRQ